VGGAAAPNFFSNGLGVGLAVSHRFCAGFGSLLLVSLRATCAHAAPGDATRLDYARSNGAASCPDRDALASAVVKRLGYDPFFPVARQTIVVQILDGEAGFRAEMHLVDADGIIRGSRELRESRDHCDELVASLALAISIALDPSAALTDDATDPASIASPANSSQLDSAEPPAVETTDNSTRSERLVPVAPSASDARRRAPSAQPNAASAPAAALLGLRASVFGSVGVAPALAAGFRFGLSMRHDWFELIGEFSDQLAASRDASEGGTVRVSVQAGSLVPCFALGAFAGCAVFDVGSLKAEGIDVAQPVEQRLLSLAVGARAELEPHLFDQLYGFINVDALKSLTPVTLRLRGENVWQTPFASILGSVGMEWKFQ